MGRQHLERINPADNHSTGRVTPGASACVKEVVRRVGVLVLVRRLLTLDRRYDGFPCYREENDRSVGVLLGSWYASTLE